MPHAERRTHVDENNIGRVRPPLEAARSAYPAKKILNFDETSWRTDLAPHRILAEKGTDAIKLKTVRNRKETFPGFGCIPTSGEKLPFWVPTKGKTDRSHLKFGQHLDVVFRHTTNGWTTEEMFTEYLTWLSQRCDGEPLFLMMDNYPIHRTQKVGDHAAGLMIHLQFVPAGATGRVQRLDRRVFGELKSRARLGLRRLADGRRGANPDQVTSILAEAWNAISGENRRKAWQFE
jgi:hypothetical protein